MEVKRYAEIKAACDAAFNDFGSPSSRDDAQMALYDLEEVMREIHKTAFFAGVDYEANRKAAKPAAKAKAKAKARKR